MKKIHIIICIALFVLFYALPLAIAEGGLEDEDDIEFFGIELEELLYLFNGIIALFLFVITFLSYKRSGRERLLYVSLAFLLLSLKSFMLSLELFSLEIELFDPIAVVVEFFVLLLFFYGVVKR